MRRRMKDKRLVSDSLYVNVPDSLPEIDFEGGQGKRTSTKAIVYNNIKMVEQVASSIENHK